MVAFARASDAVACALELQRAPLAPIRLRIGVHTGEVQLRDEGNYVGPTVNRTARLRDLAHGGQTVLSGTTSDLVVDRLPADAWLTDLGTHQLRDLPAPNGWCSCATPTFATSSRRYAHANNLAAHNLPVQLTSFVGRGAEMHDVRQILADNRLVTLTGAGGVGKTRLAVQIAAQVAGEFGDGVWYVDLAPDHRSRHRADRRGPRAGPARPTGPLHDGHARPFHRRPTRCWSCWTIVSICSTRARRWSLPCWGPVRR